MPIVTFLPTGATVEATPGESLLEVALRGEVVVPTSCGGKASCRLCVVKLPSGQENSVSGMEFLEQSAMGNVFFITRERLACQTRVLRDCTVEVPEPSTPVAKKTFRPPRPGRR
ncbi:MAG: 2Fe-2S iron-sulfur cluster-binding protein [Myxococcota bacterium]